MVSCKNPSPEKAADEKILNDSLQAQNFFPITEFIGGQVKMIDSLKPPLSKSITRGKKTHMETISDNEFRTLILNFVKPDINDTTLKKFYTETNVADQSIPSVTLIYATTNPSLTIQKINVFIKPDPVKNDKVSAIYIEKVFTIGDTAINQKLYWKTDKNFQVITNKKLKNTVFPVEQVKVIWDPIE